MSVGRGLVAANTTRSGVHRFRRLSHSQPLTSVDELLWPQPPADVIIITGESSLSQVYHAVEPQPVHHSVRKVGDETLPEMQPHSGCFPVSIIIPYHMICS